MDDKALELRTSDGSPRGAWVAPHAPNMHKSCVLVLALMAACTGEITGDEGSCLADGTCIAPDEQASEDPSGSEEGEQLDDPRELTPEEGVPEDGAEPTEDELLHAWEDSGGEDLRELERNVAPSTPQVAESPIGTTMALSPTYDFLVNLSYSTASFDATETVTITNSAAGSISYVNFSVLARNYGEVSISSVAVDGVAVTPSYPSKSLMKVALGKELEPGSTATIVVAFKGKASSDVTNSLRARFSKAGGIMQLAHWFPILSSAHDIRLPGDSQYSVSAKKFKLDLRHGAGLVVAAPGTRTFSSSTQKVYELDNARDFTFSVSPNFKHISKVVGTKTVHVYYLSGAAGSTALSYASTALATLSAKYGAYAWPSLTVVQASAKNSGSEYPGITTIGSSYLGSKYVVMHEISHQWFYGMLGNDQLNRPWLDEGLAEFAGRYHFGFSMPSYCSSRMVNRSVYSWPNAAANNDCNGYNQTVYFKAARFVNGVRLKMGSTAFNKAMRAMVSERKFGVISDDIIKAYWRKYSSVGLTTYFNQYLAQ